MGLLEETTLSLQKRSAQQDMRLATAKETGWEWGKRTYTERFRSSLMALISIFRRPMLAALCRQRLYRSWGGAAEREKLSRGGA